MRAYLNTPAPLRNLWRLSNRDAILASTVRLDGGDFRTRPIDHAPQPARALAIAGREYARHHDVFTAASYASALSANGDRARAHAEMQKVLALGVKDPRILDCAAAIERLGAGPRP